MECWKAFTAIDWFSSSKLAYLGEVVTKHQFSRPVKVASSSYSTTSTIANRWINWFCCICVD